MHNKTIAFIGAGNMAAALLQGLVTDGYPADRLIAADPDPARLTALSAIGAIATTPDNRDAAGRADILVLAVKPQVLKAVAENLAETVQARHPLVISVAAGVGLDALQSWFGAPTPLVRCMPNTPAVIQAGATALYANPEVNQGQRDAAESLLRAVGLTLWVEEEAGLDAVTALSGSGPAYVFLVIEAMIAAGERLGLPHRSAHLLALQTVLGAARMAMESDDEPATLRARVTSPGGTTERAVEVFEKANLMGLFADAMGAARDRSVELSKMLETG